MPAHPTTTKALVLKRPNVERKPIYDDAVVVEKPVPQLRSDQVLVKIGAAAFNHRDVWIRRRQYPRIVNRSVFGGDGAGTVVASGDPHDDLVGKRVFLNPTRGWKTHPEAPESEFGIVGSGPLPPIGTFSEYVVVEREEVIRSPDHLDDVHVAAWPIAGVTAWRASMVNAKVQPGDNVLITGIGGGVAITALQICIAQGANVYVTSSSADKIRNAVRLGAKGGANYKDNDWPAQLNKLLVQVPTKGSTKREFDAIIDSGGGGIAGKMGRYLRKGGRIVCYGMTAQPKITFTMREVLKNHQLIGSTMGSRQDLINATQFLSKHRIIPVVSHVLEGLENAEQGFELIKKGVQFGKIVVRVSKESQIGLGQAKL